MSIELLKSGYAGIHTDGSTVSRFEYPLATPMQRDDIRGIPEPRKVVETLTMEWFFEPLLCNHHSSTGLFLRWLQQTQHPFWGLPIPAQAGLIQRFFLDAYDVAVYMPANRDEQLDIIRKNFADKNNKPTKRDKEEKKEDEGA